MSLYHLSHALKCGIGFPGNWGIHIVARQRPFLLYRYQLLVEGEPLDAQAQLVALKELQGQIFPSGPKAERENLADTILMRPRSFRLDDGTQVFAWSVGSLIQARIRVTYDKDNDDLDRKLLEDRDSLRYADFVAVPRLGIFAVDDRSGEEFMGGSPAAHRLRPIFRQLDDEAEAIITPAADHEDFQRALKRWKITTFSFTVKPFNPHPPSALAQKLGEELKNRRVKRAHGEWQAEEDKGLRPDDEMKAIVDLAEAGYGQLAIKGKTSGGQQAEIKKSAFFEDKDKNLKSLEKPKQMRILVDTEDASERGVQKRVASVIIDLYGN